MSYKLPYWECGGIHALRATPFFFSILGILFFFIFLIFIFIFILVSYPMMEDVVYAY